MNGARGVPAPEDDGAAGHLPGLRLPSVPLPATTGGVVDLSALPGRVVVYAYPRTSRPDQPGIEGWDAIPGARGCTPQSRAFRDHFEGLLGSGARAVFGLSTQETGYQREMAERLRLPFAVLSDAGLRLTRALRLPTFEAGGMVLLKRLTLVLHAGAVEHVFYPVVPPERGAAEVAAWLRAHPVGRP